MNICVLIFFLFTQAAESYLTGFYLYTSNDPNNAIRISSQNASSYMNSKYQTQIFIPGWNSERTVSWYSNLKNAFFSRGQYNIIQVDWSELAHKWYDVAVINSPEIGQNVSTFILRLRKNGIPLKTIQIVGHSLGAQIAGYTGQYIYNQISQKLPKITALDPAGPLFTKPPYLSSYRLSENDAKVVLVIHTDRTAYGVFEECGTTDVFPNGGVGPQPGCPSRLFQAISCSHGRSYKLFISAVANPGSLIAIKCSRYDILMGQCKNSETIDLGGDITPSDQGSYYLKTTSQTPFMSVNPSK